MPSRPSLTGLESQATISAWAEATFGAGGTNAAVAARANEEMAELIRALTTVASSSSVPEEIADVLIVLFRLADRLDAELRPTPHGHPSATPLGAACHANGQLAKVLQALAADQSHPQAARFLNDAGDALVQCARLLKLDWHAEVDRKMAINRGRSWALDGAGLGYHVAEAA